MNVDLEYKKAISDMKRINLQMEVKSTDIKKDENGDEYFHFKGYLAVFDNVDRGGDIIHKGAFIKGLKEYTPSLFWMHNLDEPLGVFVSIVEDKKGLYVEAKMPMTDEFVRTRIVPQIKVGSVKSMSIGYVVPTDGAKYEASIRHIYECKLWEGSLVTIPMNKEAILDSKSIATFQETIPIAPRDTIFDHYAAKNRVMDWAGTRNGGIEDPDVQKKFKTAFVYCCDCYSDYEDDYYLLIADVIDGVLTIVPRAVFKAAMHVSGKRWNGFIPSDEIPAAMYLITKYYERMGMESPFTETKGLRIDDVKSINDVRTLENLLVNGVCLSKKQAKILISIMKTGLDEDVEDESFPLEQRDAESENKNWNDILKEINQINVKN